MKGRRRRERKEGMVAAIRRRRVVVKRVLGLIWIWGDSLVDGLDSGLRGGGYEG